MDRAGRVGSRPVEEVGEISMVGRGAHLLLVTIDEHRSAFDASS